MKNLIPRYAIIPIIVMLLLNTFTYNITPLLTNRLFHYNLSTDLDYLIPLCPVFVFPYIFAYIQWIIGYVKIAQVGKIFCYQFYFAEILSKLVTCICFILLPTTINRPLVNGCGITSAILSFIYANDAPINLFPSIHCLESWICVRSCLNSPYFSKLYKISMSIMTALVFLSTVFIKQHVIIDIFGAVVIFEISLFIIRRKNEITNNCNSLL